MLLYGGNRQNPLMGVLKMQSRLYRAYGPSLDEENTRNDLQVVCDAMLHFLQQHFLLPQEIPQLPFLCAPLGNILDAQQYRTLTTSFVEHLSGIQEHRASPKTGKVLLDLVSFHHRMV